MPGDVTLADGRVAGLGHRPAGRAGLAVPGMIDVHVHGAGGVDFLTADVPAHRTAAATLLAGGVTAYQPTFVTAAPATLEAALTVLRDVRPAMGRPRLLGAHLEGPFLSPQRLGAHDPGHRRDPDGALLERLLAAGPVATVTLAPELPGALDLIAELTARGVVASIGHTDADARRARAAFAAGATAVTHLCNAMRPLHHRDAGVVAAALLSDEVTVELIVDGHHVADDVVRLIWRVAAGRVALVSDGTAASGMPDGTYHLAGEPVTVADGVVRSSAGVLAGSALTLIGAVRNLHALGVGLGAAVGAATRVPARRAGRDDLGALTVDGIADVVVLDDGLTVTQTFVDGRRAYAA